MTRRITMALAAMLLLVGPSLSACGTPRAAGPSGLSGAQPLSVMPTASDFVSAVTHTRDLGTADVDITVRKRVSGTPSEDRGTGTVALDPGAGDILWKGTSGTKRDLGNDIALYVQSEVPNGIWTKLPRGTITTTSGFANPLGGLGTLDEVVATGTDVVAGTPTTRYAGTLPADSSHLAALGFTTDEIASIGASSGEDSIHVAVWVDGAGRVLRVDRSFTADGRVGTAASVQTSTLLSDFQGDIDLSDPPSESVTVAPSAS